MATIIDGSLAPRAINNGWFTKYTVKKQKKTKKQKRVTIEKLF